MIEEKTIDQMVKELQIVPGDIDLQVIGDNPPTYKLFFPSGACFTVQETSFRIAEVIQLIAARTGGIATGDDIIDVNLN